MVGGALAGEDAVKAGYPICCECSGIVDGTESDYNLFERMHWSCFHYTFEHWNSDNEGDRDIPCDDRSCPARWPAKSGPEAPVA